MRRGRPTHPDIHYDHINRSRDHRPRARCDLRFDDRHFVWATRCVDRTEWGAARRHVSER
jgi:hypothetical protein